MKKKDFRNMALAGLAGGLLIASHLQAADASSTKEKTEVDPNDGNVGYHMMSEDELMLQLSPQGQAMYKSLSPEGKALALNVASMRCDHTNECKGLNACKTDHNDCAGKGSCKGKGKCAIADKDLAVKLVKQKMDKMAQKRANAYKTNE
jgi:hypothetical protein